MVQFAAFATALVFPALVMWAAVKDATSYTIPNWISLALVAAFPIAALVAGLPMATGGQHLLVGGIALLMGMAMFALNWIGGGDAKLFAAGALWLGWPAGGDFLLITAVAGGLLSLSIVLLRSAPLRPLALLGPGWVVRLADPEAAIPYGVAIAIGALAAFAGSPLGKGLLI